VTVPAETPEADREGADSWRAALIQRAGWIMLLLGAPLAVYLSRFVASEPRLLKLASLWLFPLAGAFAALGRRVSFRIRGSVLVFALLFAGSLFVRFSGISPGMLLCFVLGTVLATLVFGGRVGLLALAGSALAFLVLGSAGRLATAPILIADLVLPESWFRMTAVYLLLAGLLVLLVSGALSRVEGSLAETRAAFAEAVRERRARAEAEQALRENAERLREALDAAQMGTWEWDIPGGTVVWTGHARTLLAIPPGTPGTISAFWQSIDPEDRPRLEAAIERALSGETLEYRSEYRVNGTDPPRWIEGRGRVDRDEAGRPVRMRGTLADVTVRKAAEEELRASEERWRRISEATFEGVAFSQDGLMIDANDQLAEMLGYAPGELMAKPVLECVAPEDRERVLKAIRSADTGSYEHHALRKDGSTFPVETRARALTHRGRPMRVTAVRDISERTRLEAELRQRETLAAMGSLVAGVAHEVRNPLFSLSAALDAMEVSSGLPGEDDELRSLLRPQVRRLSNLMEDLLDYGRPPRLRRVRGGITDPVRRAVRSCERLAAQAQVSVRLELHGGLPELDLDVGRIEQVFENLVANAVQLSPQGSTVRVTARPVEGPRPGVSVTVADEGPGLAPADLERVFEPFFSLRSGGTGLGLPIAHRFVEAHGGSLSVANRPEGGALFTVFLPAAIEAPPEAGT